MHSHQVKVETAERFQDAKGLQDRGKVEDIETDAVPSALQRYQNRGGGGAAAAAGVLCVADALFDYFLATGRILNRKRRVAPNV